MKLISLVPSWTETLIECGIDVVGRTRFCVHPRDSVLRIPVVGGTKDLDWDKVKAVSADLLLLDREENLPWMKELSPIPTAVTHVISAGSLPAELEKLAQALPSAQTELLDLARRWSKVSQHQRNWDWQRIPAELHPIGVRQAHYDQLIYVIWKNPWMQVRSDTFIGSMLEILGAGEFLQSKSERKYPEFQLQDFDLRKTFFLFSSEPFPFHKQLKDLENLGVQGAVVDGEVYSWFGLRSLRFLEKELYSSAAN